ncbi:cytochrome-c peroxidase [Xanthovirga aplysinae]|uniref:cytochrome-c peroxidase n=1 Tax=Xanthovirga aplysinae TaxID=2529853 RepID=UPI0012BCDD48|nr:cytochrome c peroxidase [Xanthovirga aplysinae]MTI32665.1 cytochrome-c peroxidase [Xanthovirga aplysinae]
MRKPFSGKVIVRLFSALIFSLIFYFFFFTPRDFPKEDWTAIPSPERNPITTPGVLLGRKLFFDPLLSANGEVSCASCHRQDLAFSDGQSLGRNGVSGNQLLRNAPVLVNLAWQPAFFWDGGARDLESQVFSPLTHADEMGKDLKILIAELNSDGEYTKLFKKAFQIDSISSAYVARALAQFERTIISFNSSYDQFLKGDTTLSDLALKGLKLYRTKCNSCHTEGFFTDHSYHNNGLDSVFNDQYLGEKLGRFRISRDSSDLGKYKTPSLRNIAFSGPYMHDGRFATLEEVLEHYTTGVMKSKTLDSLLVQKDGRVGIALSEKEKKAIIAFLESLTDQSFLSNPSFGEIEVK